MGLSALHRAGRELAHRWSGARWRRRPVWRKAECPIAKARNSCLGQRFRREGSPLPSPSDVRDAEAPTSWPPTCEGGASGCPLA